MRYFSSTCVSIQGCAARAPGACSAYSSRQPGPRARAPRWCSSALQPAGLWHRAARTERFIALRPASRPGANPERDRASACPDGAAWLSIHCLWDTCARLKPKRPRLENARLRTSRRTRCAEKTASPALPGRPPPEGGCRRTRTTFHGGALGGGSAHAAAPMRSSPLNAFLSNTCWAGEVVTSPSAGCARGVK